MYSKHCLAERRGMIWLYSGSFPWTYLSLCFPSPIEVELGAPSPLGQSILPPLLREGQKEFPIRPSLSRTLECSASRAPRPQGRRSLHNGGVTNLSSLFKGWKVSQGPATEEGRLALGKYHKYLRGAFPHSATRSLRLSLCTLFSRLPLLGLFTFGHIQYKHVNGHAMIIG